MNSVLKNKFCSLSSFFGQLFHLSRGLEKRSISGAGEFGGVFTAS